MQPGPNRTERITGTSVPYSSDGPLHCSWPQAFSSGGPLRGLALLTVWLPIPSSLTVMGLWPLIQKRRVASGGTLSGSGLRLCSRGMAKPHSCRLTCTEGRFGDVQLHPGREGDRCFGEEPALYATGEQLNSKVRDFPALLSIRVTWQCEIMHILELYMKNIRFQGGAQKSEFLNR